MFDFAWPLLLYSLWQIIVFACFSSNIYLGIIFSFSTLSTHSLYRYFLRHPPLLSLPFGIFLCSAVITLYSNHNKACKFPPWPMRCVKQLLCWTSHQRWSLQRDVCFISSPQRLAQRVYLIQAVFLYEHLLAISRRLATNNGEDFCKVASCFSSFTLLEFELAHFLCPSHSADSLFNRSQNLERSAFSKRMNHVTHW